MARFSCAAFLLLHGSCIAAQLAALAVLAGHSELGLGLLPQAIGLLVLQLLLSTVCCWVAWQELKSLNLSLLQRCVLAPWALLVLGVGQMIQPWLAWKEQSTSRGPGNQSLLRHATRSLVTGPPRFSCSGAEAVAQGSAFAAVVLSLLTWGMWHPTALDLVSRSLLWTCAGLSVVSASLSLVEMDQTLSETVAAALSSRPGRAFPLHLGLRMVEICSRIWVWMVLVALLRDQRVPVVALLLLDYVVTALALGGRAAMLLALPAMMANIVRFVDTAAWSIRARKATRRLAWLRHVETLSASVGAALWLAGFWPSLPRRGAVRSWKDMELFLADAHNVLPVLGAACVLLYHPLAFSLGRLHAAQVRADGLHRAAARGDVEAVSRLLREQSAEVSCRRNGLLDGLNALSPEGLAPLHLAASAGADRAVRALLRAQAEVSVAGAGGVTPLMLSAEAGHDKVLRLLLAHGAAQAISQASADGNTALHLAAREGHSECIHRLLRARADPGVVNARGLSAFDLARSQKFLESEVRGSHILSTVAASEVKSSHGSMSRAQEDVLQLPMHTGSSLRGTPERTPRPSAPSPTVTVRSNASVLDVPVIAAADSALDELLAEASRGGLRLSHVAGSVLTEASRSSGQTPFASRTALAGSAVKVTGLASLVALASPGVLRRLASRPRAGAGHQGGHSDSIEDKEYKLSYFRIVGLIGEGSFGSVYEVCDMRSSGSSMGNPLGPDRRRALKILHRRQYLAQDMLARARQERQVLKAARHPFIVRLYCAFRTPGNELALVMEYCPNGNLNDLIVRMGRPGLSEGLTRKLMAEVLLALEYLHDELDVVFRDLKPENIVLDAALHAKLTDFGLAKAEASSGAWSFVGSQYFVAPEVTPLARRYSPAVDIYTLGLVAWVCLTGGLLSEPDTAPLLGCHQQRIPPPSHEAMRSWLDDRRGVVNGSPQQRQLSELGFGFVDQTTATDPLQRGTASELRGHAFFAESPHSPRLADFNDWVAVLPSMVEEEPLSPGSVATEDSWSWDPRRRS